MKSGSNKQGFYKIVVAFVVVVNIHRIMSNRIQK